VLLLLGNGSQSIQSVGHLASGCKSGSLAVHFRLFSSAPTPSNPRILTHILSTAPLFFMPILLIRFIEKHCSVGRLGLVKNLHFHGPTSDGSEARMVANLENAIPTLVMMVSLLLIANT